MTLFAEKVSKWDTRSKYFRMWTVQGADSTHHRYLIFVLKQRGNTVENKHIKNHSVFYTEKWINSEYHHTFSGMIEKQRSH